MYVLSYRAVHGWHSGKGVVEDPRIQRLEKREEARKFGAFTLLYTIKLCKTTKKNNNKNIKGILFSNLIYMKYLNVFNLKLFFY